MAENTGEQFEVLPGVELTNRITTADRQVTDDLRKELNRLKIELGNLMGKQREMLIKKFPRLIPAIIASSISLSTISAVPSPISQTPLSEKNNTSSIQQTLDEGGLRLRPYVSPSDSPKDQNDIANFETENPSSEGPLVPPDISKELLDLHKADQLGSNKHLQAEDTSIESAGEKITTKVTTESPVEDIRSELKGENEAIKAEINNIGEKIKDEIILDSDSEIDKGRLTIYAKGLWEQVLNARFGITFDSEGNIHRNPEIGINRAIDLDAEKLELIRQKQVAAIDPAAISEEYKARLTDLVKKGLNPNNDKDLQTLVNQKIIGQTVWLKMEDPNNPGQFINTKVVIGDVMQALHSAEKNGLIDKKAVGDNFVADVHQDMLGKILKVEYTQSDQGLVLKRFEVDQNGNRIYVGPALANLSASLHELT